MGWFSKVFSKKKKSTENEKEIQFEDTKINRQAINLRDGYQREKYVRNCLEQIGEACGETDTLNVEYSGVTSYLLDLEELEALPEEEKSEVRLYASKIDSYDKSKTNYQGRRQRITEPQFLQMEKLADEMPECHEKLKKEEEKRVLIKQDLSRLEGEKQAYLYRKEEIIASMANEKGMTIIILCALILLVIILFCMQTLMAMDVKLGYLIAVAVAAIFLTFIFMKYTDASIEQKKVEKGINKLILLQNTVKVRYINNSQLLDYYYLKYNVKNSKELITLWEEYTKECEERKRYENMTSELEKSKKDLLYVLKRYQLSDPHVWLHQAGALVNRNEMLEIRHELIQRRQKLRKQLEYNQHIAEERKDEIKKLVEEYPEYAKEILKIVSEYDEK